MYTISLKLKKHTDGTKLDPETDLPSKPTPSFKQ